MNQNQSAQQPAFPMHDPHGQPQPPMPGPQAVPHYPAHMAPQPMPPMQQHPGYPPVQPGYPPQPYPGPYPANYQHYPQAMQPYPPQVGQPYPQMPMNIVVQNTQTVGGGGLVRVADRNKFVAAILAFFFGGLGVHKFYLGQTGMGIVYLIFCMTFIPTMISMVEALLLLLSSQREFDMRFNMGLAR